MAVAGDLRIMTEYRLDPVAMGLVYSAFLLGYTLFMTPGGWLVDRLGSRRSVIAVGLSTAIFAALTGMVGLVGIAGSSLWTSLVLVRFCMGVCSAPIFPAMAALAARLVSSRIARIRERADRGCLAARGRPGFSGLQFPGANARLAGAFLIASAATGLVTIVWWVTTTERGANLGDVDGEPSVDPAHHDAGGDHNGGTLRDWRSLAADRGLLLVTASYTAVGYFDFLFFYWMNYYFTTVLRLENAAWYASLPSLAMTLGIPVGGWLADRLSRRFGSRARGWVAAGGMVASAAFLFGGVLATSPMAIVTWFRAGTRYDRDERKQLLGHCDRAGRRRGATAAGFMNTGGNIGGMIAPALTPWVAMRAGWSAAIGLGALIGLAGASCWFWMPGRDEARSAARIGAEAID